MVVYILAIALSVLVVAVGLYTAKNCQLWREARETKKHRVKLLRRLQVDLTLVRHGVTGASNEQKVHFLNTASWSSYEKELLDLCSLIEDDEEAERLTQVHLQLLSFNTRFRFCVMAIGDLNRAESYEDKKTHQEVLEFNLSEALLELERTKTAVALELIRISAISRPRRYTLADILVLVTITAVAALFAASEVGAIGKVWLIVICAAGVAAVLFRSRFPHDK